MKTLYIANGSNICVDIDNNTAEQLDSDREGIQRIYLVKEPMHVVYTSGEYRRELDVKKDDIIITFYTDDFKEKIVVANSKDWVKNIKGWNEKEQKIKETWASKRLAENCDEPGCPKCCETCCENAC